jgi:septation ring formation regulator EzrA
MTELLENIDLRFLATQVQRGFARVDERFQEIEGRFEKIEGRFERIEHSINELSGAVAAIRAEQQIMRNGIDQIKETESIIEARLVRIERRLDCVKA